MSQRWLQCLGWGIAGLLAVSNGIAGTPEPPQAATAASSSAPVEASAYYVTASQLSHPLRPFGHLPGNAPIRVRAAVVTLPDPVETRLGRAFDIEVTALISAFQASGYVLDSFAFSWKPRASDGSGDTTVSPAEAARALPSVMLFRQDLWRDCPATVDPWFGGTLSCGSNYYALFLVGETPSFGIHPKAFKRAVRCALALDEGNRTDNRGFPEALSQYDCDKIEAMLNDGTPVAWNCDLHLNVIGPAFSGAMESMVAALSKTAPDAKSMACATSAASALPVHRHLAIDLLTPSASVDSNKNAPHHAYLAGLNTQTFTVDLTYHSLAYSVGDQMSRVRHYLQTRLAGNDSVVLLSEESSFGQGATTSAKTRDTTDIKECVLDSEGNLDETITPEPCLNRIVSVQFPPNIAAIRSEHVKLKQDQDNQRRALLPGRLLELDLTGVERGVDQPPTYQASLSSRSDELTLFQTFDALNKYVRPKAVIVVATDVRDRLFLLSELRDAFPGALPILLEQDNLVVHPDYRSTSRGSVTMPAGESVLCMQESGNLVRCHRPRAGDAAGADTAASSAASGGAQAGSSGAPRRVVASKKRYFTFATDYAANTFRAVVCLVNPPSRPDDQNGCSDGHPPMLVATLAGFQQVDEDDHNANGDSKRQRGILIVSDTRIELQQPVYLLMLVVLALFSILVAWLIYNGRAAALVMLPISRHALRWTDMLRQTIVARAANGLHPGDTSDTRAKMSLGERLREMRNVPKPRTSFGWLAPWLLLGLGGIVIAVRRMISMFPPASPNDTDLAHGRDQWAAICLCLAYLCFVIFALLRMQLWNARCREMALHAYVPSRLSARLAQCGHIRALVAAIVLLVTLMLCVNEYEPASVDNTWISGLSGAFALSGSSYFLVLFLEGLDRWRCASLELGKVVPVVRSKTRLTEWPSPTLLDERPRSPFNIIMRISNYHALSKFNMADWMNLTNHLITGSPPVAVNRLSIEDWQAQLVAEMKVAAEAVRTSAWCSILGATVALMLMQVYAPVYERLQTMTATVLLAIGFGGIIYAVLTLEKDFLLGRMFTNDKDGLTFAAALAALWPKLLALGSLLVTVFLPNAWDWLGGIVKAVNSLH